MANSLSYQKRLDQITEKLGLKIYSLAPILAKKGKRNSCYHKHYDNVLDENKIYINYRKCKRCEQLYSDKSTTTKYKSHLMKVHNISLDNPSSNQTKITSYSIKDVKWKFSQKRRIQNATVKMVIIL